MIDVHVPQLFDLNHDLNKNFINEFLNADIYEFNTNSFFASMKINNVLCLFELFPF